MSKGKPYWGRHAKGPGPERQKPGAEEGMPAREEEKPWDRDLTGPTIPPKAEDGGARLPTALPP